jgi:hypothetical protein
LEDEEEQALSSLKDELADAVQKENEQLGETEEEEEQPEGRSLRASTVRQRIH